MIYTHLPKLWLYWVPSKTHCIRGLSYLEQGLSALLGLQVWAVHVGMRSCCKGTCWSASSLPVLRARGCYDRHRIPACWKYVVWFLWKTKGTMSWDSWGNCMSRICAVPSGKIHLGSVYMRKGTQHLKGCKIDLLSIFLFLWYVITPFVSSEIQKKSCTICLSLPLSLHPKCRTTLKLMGSCAFTVTDWKALSGG